MRDGQVKGTECLGLSIIIIIIIIIINIIMSLVTGLFFLVIPLEPTVIPTAQTSSFTLQCFPYYV